jgi:type I restriction enzyme, S subunit
MSTVAARRAFTSAEDWQCTTLGHVAQVKGGKRLPKGEKFADTVTPFPYIRVTDFANFGIDTSDLRYLTPETRATIERYTISKNDVYISIAGSIGITGMIPARLDGANLTENAAKLVLNEDVIDSRFLMYYFASEVAQTEIRGQTVKNAQPKLALARIASLSIPLPPLPEQQKIAAVLGLVQRAIEQQERLIALTTELKKALLHKVFTEGHRGESQKQTEIGPVPESWEVSKLADLFEIKHGYAFDGAFFRPDGQYILLTPGHFFEEGGFRDQKDKTKYYIGEIPQGYVLAKGDLLVVMTEQKAGLLGSAIIIPENEKYLHNQRLGLIRNLDNQRLDMLFLFYFFNTAAVRKQIFLTSSGSKVRHTSPGKIRELSIALPRLEEQKDIAQLLQAVDAKLEVTKRKHQAITDLFRTLLHQLMTAQMRVDNADLREILSLRN